MNSIDLMGRLTADPELSYTPNSIPVCKFKIAVPRPHVKDTTDFIRCVAWRSTAEFIDTYFSKGKMIAITGVLTSRSWKDNNGNSHSINEVLVENVYFCGDKANRNEAAATSAPAEPAPATEIESEQLAIPDTFEAVEDDIPF